MIQLRHITIENFRSIIEKPLDVDFGSYTVLVGANNSGKSNVLRALNYFFNGRIDGTDYELDRDFPKYENLNKQRTRFTVTLSFDPGKDAYLDRMIRDLEQEANVKRLRGNILRIRLILNKNGQPSMQFYSRQGLKNVRRELIEQVLNAIRASVRFKYLPVGRDAAQVIQNQIADELIRTIYSGYSGAIKKRREINEAIKNLLNKLSSKLTETNQSLTSSMQRVFLEVKKLDLKLPFEDLESMLPNLSPSIKDDYETSLEVKGAGIQTSTLLFLLKYLADNHPQRHNARVTFIWAIEEPESYLHPERQKGVAEVLYAFSKDVQTIITTHCPHFVPRQEGPKFHVLAKDKASPFSTVRVGGEYEEARMALGVTLLDSMYLYPINIVTEGPSDQILLDGAFRKIYSKRKFDFHPYDIRYFPAGNAQGACVIYESLVNWGDIKEAIILLVIDGDEAGRKALNGLIQRRKNIGVNLRANQDYFQLSKSTEDLTAKKVIRKLEANFPSKISVIRNTNNRITSFNIEEGHKKFIAKEIIDLSKREDLKKFEELFTLINGATSRLRTR
jgi:putative ATP-dependent endonuclease of OLD family